MKESCDISFTYSGITYTGHISRKLGTPIRYRVERLEPEGKNYAKDFAWNIDLDDIPQYAPAGDQDLSQEISLQIRQAEKKRRFV